MTTEATLPPFLTIQELAEHINVPRSTIYQWRYRHQGPDSLKFGRTVRYRRDEVLAWLELHVEHRGDGES